MNMHKNARLTPHGRERIVRQVESGTKSISKPGCGHAARNELKKKAANWRRSCQAVRQTQWERSVLLGSRHR